MAIGARGLHCPGSWPLSQGTFQPHDTPAGPLPWPQWGCLPWGGMDPSQVARGGTHRLSTRQNTHSHSVGTEPPASRGHMEGRECVAPICATSWGSAHKLHSRNTPSSEKKPEQRCEGGFPKYFSTSACEQSPIPDKHRKCKDRTQSQEGPGRGAVVLNCRKEGR